MINVHGISVCIFSMGIKLVHLMTHPAARGMTFECYKRLITTIYVFITELHNNTMYHRI